LLFKKNPSWQLPIGWFWEIFGACEGKLNLCISDLCWKIFRRTPHSNSGKEGLSFVSVKFKKIKRQLSPIGPGGVHDLNTSIRFVND